MNERSSEFLALKRDFYGGSASPNINSKEEAHRAELEFYQNAQAQGKNFFDALSSSIVAYRFNLVLGDGNNQTYTNAQLRSGVSVFSPSIGDTILNVLVNVKDSFNGDTGYLDIGTFIGDETTGIFANKSSYGVIAVDTITYSDNGTTGLGFYNAAADFDAATTEGSSGQSNIFQITDIHPIKVVVSANGVKNGTQCNFTSGSADIIFIVLKNSAIVDLN